MTIKNHYIYNKDIFQENFEAQNLNLFRIIWDLMKKHDSYKEKGLYDVSKEWKVHWAYEHYNINLEYHKNLWKVRYMIFFTSNAFMESRVWCCLSSNSPISKCTLANPSIVFEISVILYTYIWELIVKISQDFSRFVFWDCQFLG